MFERFSQTAAPSSQGLSSPKAGAFSALLTFCLLGVSACSSSVPSSASSPSSSSELKIVASTQVYADVAERIGGERVKVNAMIPSAQDPHSYESVPQDKLQIKNASLIIANGGGYDSFVSKVAEETGKKSSMIDVVKVSGLPGAAEAGEEHDHGSHEGEHHHHEHSSFNEHVWYNVDVMKKVAEQIKTRLSKLDPSHEQEYARNTQNFVGDLEGIKASTLRIKNNSKAKSFIMTEPAPGYLFESMGLTDRTDPRLRGSVEEGNDVAPVVLSASQKQIGSRAVTFLAMNTQTQSPQLSQLKTAADKVSMPVVSLTETMPEGQSYIDWMKANVSSVEKALSRG